MKEFKAKKNEGKVEIMCNAIMVLTETEARERIRKLEGDIKHYDHQIQRLEEYKSLAEQELVEIKKVIQ